MSLIKSAVKPNKLTVIKGMDGNEESHKSHHKALSSIIDFQPDAVA